MDNQTNLNSSLLGSFKLASSLCGSQNPYVLQSSMYNSVGAPVRDTKPLIERLLEKKKQEEDRQEDFAQRIQESLSEISRVNEALQLCEEHPYVVRLFDLLYKLGVV